MENNNSPSFAKEEDYTGMPCPLPVIKTAQAILTIPVGEILKVRTTDPASIADIRAWAKQTKQELILTDNTNNELLFYIKRTK